MSLPIIQPFFRKPLRTALLQNAQAQKKSDPYTQRGNLITVPPQVWAGLSTYQGVQYPFSALGTNMDFSNGTTGWAKNGSYSVVNKVMTHVADTTITNPGIYQLNLGDWVLNKKIYLFAEMRVTNNVSTNLMLTCWASGQGTLTARVQANPVQNQWYPLSGIVTLAAGGSGKYDIEIRHLYATTEIANGKVMEVRNTKAYSITDIFAGFTEPNASQMDALIASGGQTITRGEVDLTISGVTLKNELNYTPSTMAEFTKSAGVTADATGITFSGTGSNTNAYISSNIKASTKFGFLYTVLSSTLSTNTLAFGGGGASSNFSDSGATKTVGNQKLVLTSLATVGGKFFIQNVGVATESIKVAPNIRQFELPVGSQILADFEGAAALTADQLNTKYPYIQGGAIRSTQFSSDVSSIVQNGNFANGITGFTFMGATLVSGKAHLNSAAGVDAYITQTTGITSRYFISFDISEYVSGTVRINNSSAWIVSGNGRKYAVVDTTALLLDDDTTLVTNLKISNISAINMGADTTNPLYAKTLAEMQQLFPDYVPYGVSQKELGSVKAIGKQRFDKTKATSGKFLSAVDAESVQATTAYSNYIKVNPNTIYTLSGIGEVGTYASRAVLLYDANKVLVSTVIITVVATTTYIFNSGNEVYVRCNMLVANLGTAMLNEGSTVLPYEPYTETQSTPPPVTLRDVNGMRDTMNVTTGVHTQRDNEKVLVAGDITEMITTATNVDKAKITTPTGSVALANDITSVQLPELVQQAVSSYDNVANIGKYYISASGLYYLVMKGTSLADARTALVGKTLLYQLLNPIVTQYLPSVQMNCPDGLIVDAGSTIVITPSGDVSKSTNGIITVSYPIV